MWVTQGYFQTGIPEFNIEREFHEQYSFNLIHFEGSETTGREGQIP